MLNAKFDESNRLAIPQASLIQMTYNMNRGAEQPPMKDFSDYLPYPQRWKSLEQLGKIEAVTIKAAKDFTSYYSQMHLKTKATFEDWRLGLELKSKQ